MVTFALGYTPWLWWTVALLCGCCGCCCAQGRCPEGRTPAAILRRADRALYRLVYARRAGEAAPLVGSKLDALDAPELRREMPQPSAPPVEDYAAAAASAAAAVAAADARIREFNRELNGWAQASSTVRDVHVPRR